MTRSDWVMLAALVPAVVMAASARAMGEVRLLQPVDPRAPTRHRLGDRLLFQFVPITRHGYVGTVRPRLLLVLVLFPLWAVLLDLLVPGRGELPELFHRMSTWLIVLAIVAGGAATLWVIPLLVAVSVIGAAYEHSPVAVGIAAGVLLGVPAAGLACMNYRTLLHETRMELRRRRTRNGAPLGLRARLGKRLQLLLMYAIPLMMLYEVVRALRPQFDLAQYAREFEPDALRRNALLVVALGLGWNLLLNVVPLFREMLERASVATAAAFNHFLVQYEAMAGADDDDADKKRVKQFVDGHLGPDGAWRPFGAGQRFFMFLFVLVLTANAVGQGIDKMLAADLARPDPRLANYLEILKWLMLVSNGYFLLMLAIGGAQVLRGRPAMVERTLETLWQSIERPNLVVVCGPAGMVEPASSRTAAEMTTPVKVIPAPGAGSVVLVWLNLLMVVFLCVLLALMQGRAERAGPVAVAGASTHVLTLLRYGMPALLCLTLVMMLGHPSVRGTGVGTLLTTGIIFVTCRGHGLIYGGEAGTPAQWQQLAGLWSAFTLILVGLLFTRK